MPGILPLAHVERGVAEIIRVYGDVPIPRSNSDHGPPDDIWTQCGIQFQVVAEFKFDVPPEFEQSPCTASLQDMVFAEPESTRGLIVGAIGESATWLLIDQLQPAFAEFGFAHCTNFRGKTSKYVYAQVDREDSDQATVLAHELGHVLLAFYPDPNIEDPSLVSFQFTCCDNGGEKYWAPISMCPGSALPDAACTECCVVSSSPIDVEFMRLGTCGGTTLAADQCTLVCCAVGAGTGLTAKAECLPNGGTPVDWEYCL